MEPSDRDDQTRVSEPSARRPSDHGATRVVPANPETGPLTPGKPFGARYHLIRLLGMGGMGAVYQAWDQELGVAVALKVIRPDAVADPQAAAEMERRFKRELLLARQVTHRNVVRIHDLGEIEGIKYITMPYVEGEDLSTRLKKKGKLPVPAVLAVAKEVTAGLVAAHQAGVVHRDLKPANIMLDAENHAVIMDFGIARSAVMRAAPDTETVAVKAEPTSPTGPGLTPITDVAAPSFAVGAVVGTLEFMAPEQARGEQVDQRADLFALGMILTEMLLGRQRRPAGQNLLDALNARMREQPVSLRQTDPSIPEAVDAVVMKCLQNNPADRYQTSAELLSVLEQLDADGRVIPQAPPQVVRRTHPKVLVAAGVVVVALVGVTWWMASRRGPSAPAAPHAPLSILIADFKDGTHDPTLQSTIEQSFGIALEGASFITTFPRATAKTLATQLRSANGVDEATAQLIAVREGVAVILAGAIEPKGSGFSLAVRAIDPAGKELHSVSADAATKADLLPAVSQLASKLRDRFGDTTPAGVRQADAETFTAASLDAVREYALAQDLASAGKDEEAITHYQAALATDPAFGRAQSGWAVSARKLGRLDEAADAYKKAFALLDRMTEREKLRTLGAYYLQFTGAYDKAVENYAELVKRYPADRGGHSNLAVSYFYQLDFPKALEEAQQAIRIYQRNPTFQNNYALFLMYASDFTQASQEAGKIVAETPGFFVAYLPIAMAAIDNATLEAATETYQKMAGTGASGASRASSGLADLAILTGKYAVADASLRAGIAADGQAKRTEGSVAKYIALADTLLAQGKTAEARKAAEMAAGLSAGVPARVPAARVYIRTGAEAEARKIADELGAQLQPQKRAYGKILEAEIDLARHQAPQAVEALQAARKLTDHWLGRFDLGVAYVEAGSFPEAVSELEIAQKRRGEATSLFLDDWPTAHYLATLPYWLGRAHEGLGTTAAARAQYEAFLKLRPAELKDPLAVDAQRRLAALGK